MAVSRRELLTIPNVISAYRLLVAPWIVYLALTEQRDLFLVFLCVSLLTDVLDGFIARTWHMQSAIGARLDSIADDLTYIAAIVGIFQFEYDALRPHILIFYVFLTALLLTTLVPLVRFGRTPAFHLYLFRAAGYLQGLYVFVLFTFGFDPRLHYLTFGLGILASIEVIAVALVVKAPITNARGLYWVLRDRRLRLQRSGAG